MPRCAYVITYDVGTTAIKTCLFHIDKQIRLMEYSSYAYPLQVLDNGGAEQNPGDWWHAMCITTKQVLDKSSLSPSEISGISFCSQMQGLVLVDKDGIPVRPAMSYMDQRAGEQLKEGLSYGPQIAGCNAYKLLKSLYLTKAVAASVKDPVWKYKWVEKHEPDNFAKVHKWLDVKEFLIHQCTGEFVMTTDSAFATLLFDIRKGHTCFSKKMCDMFGVNYSHLPRIINSTDQAGILTQQAAEALGLSEGTPVFGGGGDASLIGVGAGAVRLGSTHIYCGTSGWVSTVVDKPMVDTSSMIAAVIGAHCGHYNYFAELETAGKCLEWVKDHLALDEIDIYLEKRNVTESYEKTYTSLYEYMMYSIRKITAGSEGVIFTPWLHGNRCPFEDPNARGMFFNIGLDTGKTQLIRSVLEGVCYHMRWMLEAQENKVTTSQVIRFVGGGALSSLTCQILADILGRKVETVPNPQNVGAVGAALVVAVGIGLMDSLEHADDYIEASEIYLPNAENKKIYDKYFKIFKMLYQMNKKVFAAMNK
ncbi:MAG TPA: FGGY-family carbohydrate kinase [Mobilitalea sp.]|nr:FGGY-family carbohydrate kinase [Mobilitalea sp.]